MRQTYTVTGMSCAHCAAAVTEELGKRLRRDGVPVRVLHRDLGRE